MSASCVSSKPGLTAGLLCCSIGEERGAVEGLLLLWRRLNAELQRMQASPAAALLDQVLRAMDPASGLVLRDRQQVLLLCWELNKPWRMKSLVPLTRFAVIVETFERPKYMYVCCEADFQPLSKCHVWHHIKLPYSLVQLQPGSNEYALQLAAAMLNATRSLFHSFATTLRRSACL